MATEHRFIAGAKPPEKVILDFYRCEVHNTCHFYASDEFVKLMQRVFAKDGIELIAHELKKGEFPPDQAHKVLEVFTAVHEVQGLKWEQGCSPLEAIESLVAKYAELK